MGVTTDIWRARIGAFAPIMSMISSKPRRISSQKKRYRVYKKPVKEPSTQGVTVEILLFIILLLAMHFLSRHCPMTGIREDVFNPHTAKGVIMMYLAVSLHRDRPVTMVTWQEKKIRTIQLVLFTILLLCGDIESNPGPGPDNVSTFRL